MELNDFGYLDAVVGNLEQVRTEQAENIAAAASLMADAIAEDRLIHVYGGGGHKMASGCTLDCGTETAVEKILAAIDQVWPA